jgi:hypothetical protein
MENLKTKKNNTIMKTAQLIKVTSSTLYLRDGNVINEVLSPSQKLQFSLFGETKTMKVEEVIERWNIKSKKEAEKRFWYFMIENKIEDSSIYYIVFADI